MAPRKAKQEAAAETAPPVETPATESETEITEIPEEGTVETPAVAESVPVVAEVRDSFITRLGKTTREIFAAFKEPFDTDLLYWKPQTVNKDKDSCQVAVYADPRAYADRLNEVVGPDGWSTEYETVVVPYHKKTVEWVAVEGQSKKQPKDSWTDGHKLIVRCRLTVEGFGTHEDVGEEETGNDNVATAAFAQAFKRACVTFGIGRYLYDFPKGVWCDYDDKKKRVKNPPALPDFAVPKYFCDDCSSQIFTITRKGKDEMGNDTQTKVSPKEIKAQTKQRFGKGLCVECAKKLRDQEAAKSGATQRLQ